MELTLRDGGHHGMHEESDGWSVRWHSADGSSELVVARCAYRHQAGHIILGLFLEDGVCMGDTHNNNNATIRENLDRLDAMCKSACRAAAVPGG